MAVDNGINFLQNTERCLHGLWFDEYSFTGDGFLCTCITYNITHLLLKFHMK
jgi:hypothetical protein